MGDIVVWEAEQSHALLVSTSSTKLSPVLSVPCLWLLFLTQVPLFPLFVFLAFQLALNTKVVLTDAIFNVIYYTGFACT